MTLLKLYEEILKTAMMNVDKEGFVHQPKSYENDGTRTMEPALIDGKRLVVPVQEHIDHPNKETKVVFHPLNENALQGESAVINKLKVACSISVNMAIFNLIRGFMNLALSTDDHKKLSPDQSEVLSILKNVDEKTEKDFFKIIFNGIKKEGTEALFFKIFLKRGGTVMGKKYSRVGVVTFPFYDEISQDKNEFYGITLRKKDHGVLKKLIEFILPKIKESHAYDQGSDDDVAPYLDALMQSIAAVGVDINRCIKDYEEFLIHPDSMKIHLGWQKAFKDLNSFLPEVRRIPVQQGNQGNRKVEDIMRDEANIQQAVNQASRQALNRQEAIKEEVTPVKPPDTTAPWEELPAVIPSSPHSVQVASAPLPSLTEIDNAAKTKSSSHTGTISATDLLGITQMPMNQGYQQMPNANAFIQQPGMQQPGMMPGQMGMYPQQPFYNQQPMMQQAPAGYGSPFYPQGGVIL